MSVESKSVDRKAVESEWVGGMVVDGMGWLECGME